MPAEVAANSRLPNGCCPGTMKITSSAIRRRTASTSPSLAALEVSLWNGAAARRVRGPRVPPSPRVANTFIHIVCRVPTDPETVQWDTPPLDQETFEQTLALRDEARRVNEIRPLYLELLRREAT